MKTVRKNVWWSLGLIIVLWYGASMLANAETMGLRYLSTDAISSSSYGYSPKDTSGERYCTLNKDNYYTVNGYSFLKLDCEIDCGTVRVDDSKTYLVELAIQIDGIWREIQVYYLDGGTYNSCSFNLSSKTLEEGDYQIKLSLFRTNNVTDTTVLAEDQSILTVTDSLALTVSFDYCGGTGNTLSWTVYWGDYYGGIYCVALPTATRDGYNFLGWYTKKNGGEEIKSYTTVTTWGEHTLYAHWEESTLKQTIAVPSSITKTYVKNGTFNLGASAVGTLSYTSSNKKVATVSSSGKITMKGYGTAKIKITAAASGAYKKTIKTITVTIKPAKMTLSSVKSPSTKTMLIKWKSDTKASGYQVQVSTSKKFTSGTTLSKSTSNVKNKKVTLKNLTKGKKYYVRIRAYKTVSGKKIYGTWSSVKSVTVK